MSVVSASVLRDASLVASSKSTAVLGGSVSGGSVSGGSVSGGSVSGRAPGSHFNNGIGNDVDTGVELLSCVRRGAYLETWTARLTRPVCELPGTLSMFQTASKADRPEPVVSHAGEHVTVRRPVAGSAARGSGFTALTTEANVCRRVQGRGLPVLLADQRNTSTPQIVVQRFADSTLEDYLVQRPGPWAAITSLWIARQISASLADLHSCGYSHQGLEPSAVLLRSDGVCILTELWRARDRNDGPIWSPGSFATQESESGNQVLTESTATESATTESAATESGTPEWARGDVHGLAAILYRLLTGTALPPSRDGLISNSAVAALRRRYDLPTELRELTRELLESASAPEGGMTGIMQRLLRLELELLPDYDSR